MSVGEKGDGLLEILFSLPNIGFLAAAIFSATACVLVLLSEARRAARDPQRKTTGWLAAAVTSVCWAMSELRFAGLIEG